MTSREGLVQQAKEVLERNWLGYATKPVRASGIDLNAVAQKLHDSGVNAYNKFYDILIASIEENLALLKDGSKTLQSNLGPCEAQAESLA